MNKKTERNIIKAQINELTEHIIYKKLSELTKNSNNSNILKKISEDEIKHHNYWKTISKKEVKPKRFIIQFYIIISYVLGLSFGLKLMERGEKLAQKAYSELGNEFSKRKDILLDEQKHEKKLLTLFEEEKLEYASSIVLGLNDALVELTGVLAGLTFALQNGKLIALIGLITGIAASMSMAASGYLSAKEEGINKKKPLKSAVYTGMAYIITVIFLVLPFFLLTNVFLSLILTIIIALLIISSYTFYISIAKELKFWNRFLEMGIISITIAFISFIIGFVIKRFFGVDI